MQPEIAVDYPAVLETWGLVVINASFDAVRLLLFSFILAYWR
jgi:hypothetical protein